MRDQRLDKLARILVEYSTKVQPGQIVRISGDPIAMPLIEAIYEATLAVGAHPYFKCRPDTMSNYFMETATDEQLKFVNPLDKEEVEVIDVSIGIWAETNTKSMSRIDPKKQGIVSAARKPVFKKFLTRSAAADKPDEFPGIKPLRWVGTLFPTEASAQDAEMSLAQYEKFVFGAGYLDLDDPVAQWRKINERQQKVADYLNGTKIVHFETEAGTDLTVNVDGMTWINCSGEANFPDGEVFTGPNLNHPDGGVNGIVKYSFPAVHNGREVHDIEMTFEKGKVVDAKASKNQDFLLAMLDLDPGARFLGEIAIGTNYSIVEYTKNTLFDEKIGGTFHGAVGEGYPESGNSNESGLHWDMVCDLRPGGTITVDGEMISKDGQFIFDDWPGTD